MTDNLRRSIYSSNGSSQNRLQGMAEAPASDQVVAASRPVQLSNPALAIQAMQILDSSDDCIKVLDLAGQILFMNRGGQALLGIQNLTPLLNTSWIEFWQGEDRQAASAAIAQARTGEVCTFQGYCPTLSGEPKWWDSKISPIRGADGQVEQLLCISRDITERKQIEDKRQQAAAASRETDKRYQAIINQAVAGIACTSLAGKLTLVNQKYCDITGYSAAELSQLRMQDITHPEDLPRNVELFHRLQTAGTPFEIEKRYIRKDGSIVWVNNSVYVIRDRDSKPQSAVAIVLDITERKQAAAALKTSEEQFRLFTAASSNTVYKMSADWHEMRLLVGKDFLTSIQHPSQTWLEKYIPPEEQSRVIAAIAAAIRTKSTFELEHQVIQLDGTIGWAFSRAIPLLNDQNEIIEWLGTASDVTARKQAEAERERLLANEQQARAVAEASREEAQAANRVKDEFLAVLSHELRSPLNPILGWTRLLQNGKLDPARQQEALATIERNAKLQTQLIEDLLDISRIMQGKLSLTVAPVNLTFVITAAVETVRLAAEAKQIQILLDLTTAIVPVSGDAARLQQVVWNLLTNAVKFTPNGGQVTVELRQIDQLAQVRVSDTGKGIAPDFLPHVFEYFRQADATTTRQFGGLGLGLAIARQIVEIHGGTVWAESTGENQGAIFTVQLPLSPQASAREVEPLHPGVITDAPLNNLHILLVDDETDAREFQAFVLEQRGARVTAVASGFEALQVLERCIPDILVSDVGMAEMDGYMLIQQIRSRPRDRGGMIPAIALTAYVRDSEQQKALQAGFQQHLSKPVEPEAFVQAIVRLYQHFTSAQ